MKIQDINLKISFSNDINTTYKVIQFEEELEIIEYQIDMIRNNQVNGLLTVDARYKDNVLNLYYDITSKQSLGDFIKRVELGKKETLDIIEKIARSILQSENFLLDSSCFLIDDLNIYINPQNMNISLMYLPIKIDQNINESVKAFLIQFIVYNVQFKKEETDTIISQILTALKDDQFNLKSFVEKIQIMRQNNQPIVEEVQEKQEVAPKKVKNEKPSSLEAMITNKNNSSPAPDQSQQINKVLNTNKKSNAQEPTYKTKRRFKKSALLLAVISQVVLLIVMVLFGNTILDAAGRETSSYVGISIFILAVEGLIFKHIFSLENMEEVQILDKSMMKNKSEKSEKPVQNHVAPQQQNVIMNKKTINNVEMQQPIQQNVYKQPTPEAIADQTSLLSNDPNNNQFVLDETVLLSSATIKPYLSRLSNNGMERIDLIKSNFVIGRQHGVVNYTVEEQAIGRMHAEFITENGQYFIKDLNTRNGTFVNEQRLVGDQQVLLNTDDKIKLANIDFTFNLEK